jgi:hypothetical protein
MPFGSLTSLDNIDILRLTVYQYGEERLYQDLIATLGAHNQLARELAAPLVDFTTDRIRRVGTTTRKQMQRANEFSRPLNQKIAPTPADVGFPLELWQQGIGWTRDYLRTRSVEEAVREFDAARLADLERIQLQVKHALFDATNYTFLDERLDWISLPIKALANADGFPIPLGPNNRTFNASTHSHYLANATFTEAAAKGLVDTVLEHDTRGKLMFYIPASLQDLMMAFTAFKPYVDARIVQPLTASYAGARKLDITDGYNRAIGIFRETEVWIKPWVPENYAVVIREGAGMDKVLVWRTREPVTGAGDEVDRMGNLRIVADVESFPLRAQYVEREFGIGVQNRINAAVLYIGGSSYVAPTLE